MRLEDYTGENILVSMGLSLPTSKGVDGSEIWIVFKPSFHPEVAIVFSSLNGPSARISAFYEMLWHQPSVVRLPVVVESHAIASTDYGVLDENYFRALKAADAGASSLCIDGMGIEAWRYSPTGQTHFDAHVYGDRCFNELVSAAVSRCWPLASDPQLKNALADVAHYIGLELPKQSLPEPPLTTHLLVLGTPEDRADYLRQLDQHKQTSNKAKQPDHGSSPR